MRVNLIRSILVFWEKKYCVHDNAKLVFFKKNIQKLYTLIKKKRSHSNSASELHCSREQCNSLALFTYTVQWIALFACTVQVNCTVHAKTKVKKAARSCFANFTFKTWIGMGPTSHEIAFWILPKYHVCCGCFKRRSNHANKRPLTPQLCQRFLWPEHVWNRLIFFI